MYLLPGRCHLAALIHLWGGGGGTSTTSGEGEAPPPPLARSEQQLVLHHYKGKEPSVTTQLAHQSGTEFNAIQLPHLFFLSPCH